MYTMIIFFLGRNIDAVQKLIIIVMLSLLCMLAYLIILNIKTLLRVSKMQQNDKKTKIDDARYYELNNKIQLIIVVASIIMLIGGFLGYNSIDSIKLEIQDKLDEYIDKLNGYDTIIYKYNMLIPTLENERDTTFKSLIKTKIESEKTKSSLVQLQNDYRLNAKTYFVKGVKIDPKLLSDNAQVGRIYFKDLKPNNPKVPSSFPEEPFITVVGIGDGIITIKKITIDYFDYTFSGFTEANKAILEIFETVNQSSINQEDKELLESIKSLLRNSIKNDKRINNTKYASTFDLIVIEGINQF